MKTTPRPVCAVVAFAVISLRAEPPPPTLVYDVAAFELAPSIPRDPAPWHAVDAARTVRERGAREQARRELAVNYYRIGHTLAFRLPVDHRPTRADLPAGISTMTYPWMIWLAWELEERWRILHASWRTHGDTAAANLLQRELAALAGWDRYCEMSDQTGLVTAHLAACLSLALADERGWDASLLKKTRTAAAALLDRDVAPWFAKQWAGETFTPQKLVNIPFIALVRAAQLARITGHPLTAALEQKSAAVLRAWCRFRTGPERHTEGTAYDGYLMDSVTEWLAGAPERAALLTEGRAAFRTLADEWLQFALPGRADLHAPLGDVEGEMVFWAPPLLRLAAWYDWTDAAWLLARVPLMRLPAATVTAAAQHADIFTRATPPDAAAAHEHAHALTFRTGWKASDLLAVVSVSRGAMGHLHNDAGHLILGWQGRFWITDPGYQQYRPGQERDYTIDAAAHSGPVINGEPQKTRAARLLSLAPDAGGAQHAAIDLTACYKGLPKGAAVRRDVWVRPDGAIAVRDSLRGLAANATIGTHWLGGTQLAWAFVDGWARLSDGRHAVWIGTWPDQLAAASVVRQPGSRGPLTLAHSGKAPDGNTERWWFFWCDDTGGWQAPALSTSDRGFSARLPSSSATPWKIVP
ncbi:MAG: heparinase II/III family protein [Verrucomicrobia bacterium]|nr:heparinase II/III family protein [Verrucomicrobiota bacterium]